MGLLRQPYFIVIFFSASKPPAREQSRQQTTPPVNDQEIQPKSKKSQKKASAGLQFAMTRRPFFILQPSLFLYCTDFFETEKNLEDLGIGRDARGVFAFTIVAKYPVIALKDMSPHSNGESHLYVTIDAKSWVKAQFPHSSSAQLKGNVYAIVESTTHSLAVDIDLRDINVVGTEYNNNSNGSSSRSSYAILPTSLFTSIATSGFNWFVNNGLTDFSQQSSSFLQGSSKTYIPHQQQS
ncbi:vacuolar protein sorting/targeting protein PEP1 [Stygiomarasmius scandens]|uniref:Vacuolar protein sorting/targeting protein PEP1 n=1 Tax=Marasmiellus scandens TaxID=2682957 RepID=A0ABR1IJ36_9AGAR